MSLSARFPRRNSRSACPWGFTRSGRESSHAPGHLPPGQTAEDALRFLRYLAGQSHLQEIHYLWRPFLPDADDDMVLELAFAAGCRYVVTHNVNDFCGSEQLGIKAIPPRDFLNLIRKQP